MVVDNYAGSVRLQLHSHHSGSVGTVSLQDMVNKAIEYGMPALVSKIGNLPHTTIGW